MATDSSMVEQRTEAWFLAALEKPSLDASALLDALKQLRNEGQVQPAESWAELLQDALGERGQKDEALRVLETRALWGDAARTPLRTWDEEVLDILGSAWEEKTLVDQAGAGQSISPREGLRRVRLLRALQPEVLCYDRTWGLGVVLQVDFFNKRIEIDFERKLGHQLSMSHAAQHLQIAGEDHLLVWKRRRPDDLSALAKSRPGEVVRMAIRSFGPMPVTELQQRLTNGIVRDADWKTFWDAARKELKKDEFFQIPKGRSENLQFVEGQEQRGEEWFTDLLNTRDLIKVAELLEELVVKQAGKPLDTTARAVVADRLAFAIKGCTSRQQGLMVRCIMAAVAVGVEPVPGAEPDFFAPQNFVHTMRQLSAKATRGFLRFLAGRDAPRLRDLLVQLMRTLDLGTLSETITYLDETGEGEMGAKVFRQAISGRQMTIEMLSWLARDMARFEIWHLGSMHPVLGMMVDAMEETCSGDTLKAQNQLRERFAKPEWLRDILAHLDPTQRTQLFLRVKESQAFPHLDRQLALAQFIKIYPELETLMMAKVGQTASASRGSMTSMRSYQERQDQLQKIINVELPQVARDIGVARSYGDLRENHEYKAAKEHQTILLHRRDELHNMLQKVTPTDFADFTAEGVGMATTVTIRYEDGRTETYHILGEWDGDTSKGIISSTSRMAVVLQGHQVGDRVLVPTESGETTIEVLRIDPLPEEIRTWLLGNPT